MRTLHEAICPPNGWCGGLFAHLTGGAVTAPGCSPTKRVVRTSNWWCTGLFLHRTGGAVTAWGCSPTGRVVQSLHRQHNGSLHVAVCPPNGWCSHHMVTAWGCSPTERVVRSLQGVVRPHNGCCGHCTCMAICPPNWWCSHRTGLFAHRTSGAVTARGCSPTERVVRPPNGDVRLCIEQVVRSPCMAVCPPNGTTIPIR